MRAILPTVERRVPFEPRLERVQIADGRDPDRPPPLKVLWQERVTRALGGDQFTITMPFVGGPVGDGVHAELTAELSRRLLDHPARPWIISSVAAAVRTSSRYRGHLTLAITASCRVPSTRLDGVQLCRELDRALASIHSARRGAGHGARPGGHGVDPPGSRVTRSAAPSVPRRRTGD